MDEFQKSASPANRKVKIKQKPSKLDQIRDIPEILDQEIKDLQAKTSNLKDVHEKQLNLNILKQMKLERQKFQPKLLVKDQKDPTTWKFTELQSAIKISCDLDLLPACNLEFHRRLKVYHEWKTKNRKKIMIKDKERAPKLVFEAASKIAKKTSPRLVLLGSVRQRYFKVPFQNKGWWYAHFDGAFVARQMNFNGKTTPVLLVAGRDDLLMCELSLEETGLHKKPEFKIQENDFNKKWTKHGGKPYVPQADRKDFVFV